MSNTTNHEKKIVINGVSVTYDGGRTVTVETKWDYASAERIASTGYDVAVPTGQYERQILRAGKRHFEQERFCVACDSWMEISDTPAEGVCDDCYDRIERRLAATSHRSVTYLVA